MKEPMEVDVLQISVREKLTKVVQEELGTIPEVEAVFALYKGAVIYIWTVVGTPTQDVQSKVLLGEAKVIARFPEAAIDFRIAMRDEQSLVERFGRTMCLYYVQPGPCCHSARSLTEVREVLDGIRSRIEAANALFPFPHEQVVGILSACYTALAKIDQDLAQRR